MKTFDEIKKGLRCLSHDRTHTLPCSDCEYHGQGLPPCRTAVHEDAIALTEQLEAENKRYHQENTEMYAEMCMLREKVHRLEAERDAAVAGLKKAANEKGECFECKWYNGKNCTHQDYKTICCSHDDKWEWRGVQKEE